MFPGINPRMMKQAMKKMGIKEEALEVSKVVMKLSDGSELVFDSPQVSKVDMMGQETYQVVGEPEVREAGSERDSERSDDGSDSTEADGSESSDSSAEEDTTPEINDEDIETVAQQTGCSKEKAKEVLEECKGDLAEAILKIKNE